jgi:hypothetical protein
VATKDDLLKKIKETGILDKDSEDELVSAIHTCLGKFLGTEQNN